MGFGMLALVGSVVAAEPEPLWTVELGEMGPPWTRIEWIGFSPNGREVIVRTVKDVQSRRAADFLKAETTFRVWDARAGWERYRSNPVTADETFHQFPHCAVIPGGGLLVAGDRLDHQDLKDGKAIGVWSVRGHVVSGVWVTADGKRFIAVENDRERAREGLTDRQQLVSGSLPHVAGRDVASAPLRPEKDRDIHLLAVSPDGTRLAAVESPPEKWMGNPALVLRGIEVGPAIQLKLISQADLGDGPPVRSIAFSPDGRILAVGLDDGMVSLWDVPGPGAGWTRRAVVPSGNGRRAYSLAFRPDGKVLAVGTWEKSAPDLWLVDVATGEIVRRHRIGPQPNAVAFSPDGKTLATGTFTGRLQLWDADKLLKGE
jgi:WD40 repeat protein